MIIMIIDNKDNKLKPPPATSEASSPAIQVAPEFSNGASMPWPLWYSFKKTYRSVITNL